MSSPDKAEGRIRDAPWPSPRGSRMRFAYPGYGAYGAGRLPLSHRKKGMVVTVGPLARATDRFDASRLVARIRPKAASGTRHGPAHEDPGPASLIRATEPTGLRAPPSPTGKKGW